LASLTPPCTPHVCKGPTPNGFVKDETSGEELVLIILTDWSVVMRPFPCKVEHNAGEFNPGLPFVLLAMTCSLSGGSRFYEILCISRPDMG
jgi:hypothetical protein